MQKKKIAMLISAVMILSGTAMPSEMAYAMDDIQISAEETDEAGSSEESEPEDQETDVEEDADDFEDDSSDEEVSVEPQDGENESEDEISVFSDEENAAVGEDEKGEPVESGSCGGNATYKLYADGTLYIEGTGEIGHYFQDNDDIKSVVIGEGLTSISYWGTFQGDKNLVSVTLPESLTDLGNSTFEYCSNLTTINLPEGLTSIGVWTFCECSSLTEIKLPESLKDIGNVAFSSCSNLNSINLPEGLISIGRSAFSECVSLSDITLPQGVTSIGGGAFYGCSSLTSVNLPRGLTSIEEKVFLGCTSLSDVTLPTSVTCIETEAFKDCSNLTSLDFSHLTSIGDSAFYGCGFKTVTIPESVTDIGNYVFSYCDNLRSAKLPSNIEKISDGLFNSCRRFSEFEIPASVKEIGNYAFSECNALTEITLPESLTSIGDSAFAETGITEFKLPTGLQSIGNYAFGGANITTIELPESVTKIGDRAFSECQNLKSIIIPKSVTDLGSEVFWQCWDLETVEIKANINELKEETFHWNSSLKNVTLPESLTKIGKNAFYACGEIESINLPDKVTEIDEYAFMDCIGLKNISFSSNLISIGYGAFYNCYNLIDISLPEKLQTIDTDAFKECDNLRSVYIPGTDVELASKAIGYKGDNTKCDNIVVIGKTGSTTEAYAKKNSFTFHNVTDKLTHVPAVAATCLAKGNVEYWHCDTCNINFSNEEGTVVLDQTETDIIPHDLVRVDEINPTCTETGVRYHWYCNSCGKYFRYSDGTDEIEDVVIPAKGHNMHFQEGRQATCYSEGRKDYYHCSNCGKNFLDEKGKQEVTEEDLVIPKNDNHDLRFYQGHEATCEIEGEKDYYRCADCDKIFLDIEGKQEVTEKDLIIPKNNNHDLRFYQGHEATCEIEGEKDCYRCADCDKIFLDEKGTQEVTEEELVIPRNNNHNLIFYQGCQATCSDEGRKDWYHCSNCGKDFLDEKGTQEVTEEELFIPKNNNHDLRLCQGHEATCYGEGRKDYYQCSTCGKLFLDENGTQEVTDPDKELRIPRKEHKMVTTKTYLPIAQPINPSDGRTHLIESIIQMSCQTKCTVCGWQEGGYGIAYKVVVNIDSVTLKYGQSTTAIRISGLNSDIKFKKVTSGNKKIVTISDVNSKKGTFKLTAGKKSGSTVVRIELSGGWTADVQITVQSGTVKTNYITGLKKSVTVSKGKTYTLKPGLDPITSQEKVTYSSSNTKVATVSSKGVITGKAAGTAKITVKSGSKKATVTVKVEKVKTTKLSGVPSSKTVKKGKTFTIKASVTPKNSDEKVIYKTSNKKIATVTSKGVVKGIKKGTATVTVQSGSKKQTCKVTVK